MGERGMPGHAGRPDGEADRHLLAAGHLDRAGQHASHARVRADLDALAPELASRALGQRGVDAAQDLVARLDEQQPVVARIDAAITRHDVALEEVLQLRDQLDAGISTSDDTHGEACWRRAAGSGSLVGVLGRVEDVVAQHMPSSSHL